MLAVVPPDATSWAQAIGHLGPSRESTEAKSGYRGTEEKNEFVFRHYAPTIPPAVTYGITKRMKDIEKVLKDLERLARKWKGEELATTES